jgi:hypothetical protein
MNRPVPQTTSSLLSVRISSNQRIQVDSQLIWNFAKRVSAALAHEPSTQSDRPQILYGFDFPIHA